MCMSLAACGGNSNSNSTNVSKNSQPVEPSRDLLEKVVVHHCCQYSNVKSVSISYGTFDTFWDEEENVWVTNVKGTYYPIDEFGNYGDKMQFGLRLHGANVEEITDPFWEVH